MAYVNVFQKYGPLQISWTLEAGTSPNSTVLGMGESHTINAGGGTYSLAVSYEGIVSLTFMSGTPLTASSSAFYPAVSVNIPESRLSHRFSDVIFGLSSGATIDGTDVGSISPTGSLSSDPVTLVYGYIGSLLLPPAIAGNVGSGFSVQAYYAYTTTAFPLIFQFSPMVSDMPESTTLSAPNLSATVTNGSYAVFARPDLLLPDGASIAADVVLVSGYVSSVPFGDITYGDVSLNGGQFVYTLKSPANAFLLPETFEYIASAEGVQSGTANITINYESPAFWQDYVGCKEYAAAAGPIPILSPGDQLTSGQIARLAGVVNCWSAGQSCSYWTIEVPSSAKMLTVSLGGDLIAAATDDLYLRLKYGTPDLGGSNYDGLDGVANSGKDNFTKNSPSNWVIQIDNPAAGTWYVAPDTAETDLYLLATVY